MQVLKYEMGSFEFVFPMVVGHRFKGESTPDPEKVATPIVPEGMRTGATIDLDVDITGGAPITAIESDLHKILIENVAPDRAKVKLAKLDEIPNRDFILRYSVAGKDVVGALLTHREPAKGGFFTLIVMPPKAVAPELVGPKEMILVVDQSGSQMGEPIEKSRELTKKAIDALNPQDTFNVVSFSNTYEVLWPKSRPNSSRNREQAKAYVDKLAAQGGTQLEQAVRAALTLPTDADRPRIVVFNTDGFIGGEAEALKMIQKHRGNARMFTFGIGNSTNRYLIEAMSTEGRGAHEIVTLQSDIDAAIARLVQRVDAPVLTDVQVRFEGVAVEDVLPRNIPDLFGETPVIVKGRYSRPGEGTVTVSGRLAGKPWSRRYPVHFPAEGNSGSSIGSLWAREKVDDLEHLERMESVWGNSAQTRGPKYWEDAITELCLRFAIMSRFTSFVAVDQTVVNPGGQQKTIPVPLEMADGVSYEGIFGTSGARIGGKSDERLAQTPAVPAFRAGDPLLEIAAPADATVVAVFPDGDTKPLRWNPKTSRWEGIRRPAAGKFDSIFRLRSKRPNIGFGCTCSMSMVRARPSKCRSRSRTPLPNSSRHRPGSTRRASGSKFRPILAGLASSCSRRGAIACRSLSTQSARRSGLRSPFRTALPAVGSGSSEWTVPTILPKFASTWGRTARSTWGRTARSNGSNR